MHVIKERILQILFVPALFWASIVIFSNEILLFMQRFAGVENSVLHNFKEILIFIIIFSVATFICFILYYLFPGFLLLSKFSSFLSIVLRLVVYTPVIFIVLAVGIFFIWWMFVVSSEAPTHSQYGLSAWYAAFFYGVGLTPLFTLIAVWVFDLDNFDREKL